jgi:hypothetical protein
LLVKTVPATGFRDCKATALRTKPFGLALVVLGAKPVRLSSALALAAFTGSSLLVYAVATLNGHMASFVTALALRKTTTAESNGAEFFISPNFSRPRRKRISPRIA